MINEKKWPALDFVKFACVAVMILAHAHTMLIAFFYKIIDVNGFFYKVTDKFMFVGLFIMILPMLAGVVFRVNGDFGVKKTFKLAVFLAVIGFLMNAATWGWPYLFSWNVLQFIGLSFLIIAFLKKYFSNSNIAIVFFSLLAIFAAAPLRLFLSTMKYNYLFDILLGANNGQTFWPLLPWFGLVGLGFVFADYYIKIKDARNKMKFNIAAALAGAVLVVIAILRNEISPRLDPMYFWGGGSVFQPKIGWILAIIGLFCVLVAGANVFLNRKVFKKYGIVNSYSKGILWIYITQMFVNYHLAMLIKFFFPMNVPSLAYFILPIFIVFFSWFIGALSIKLFAEKRVIITLKEVQ
ncbi:MAG: heparan-alpha-glucosaminide N-acetyltransferase domain-containing protein [Candidatus Paceibacterota bacterium]